MSDSKVTFGNFVKEFPGSQFIACKNKVRTSKKTYSSQAIQKLDTLEWGWLVPEGYIVLDFDTDLEVVESFLRSNDLWGKTTMFRTPKGGLHLIFKDSKDQRTQKVRCHLACGLQADLRTAGKGYIITPWGNAKGREIISMRPPMDIPASLEPLTIRKDAEQFITFPLEQGQRNDSMFKQASRLRGDDFDQDQIELALTHINRAFVDPPLNQQEVRTIAESVCKYEPGREDEAFALFHPTTGQVNGVDTEALLEYLIATEAMFAISGDLYVYRDGVYAENGIYIRDLIKKHLPRKYVSFSRVMEVYKLLCDDIRIQLPYSELNTNKHLINMKNGMFDLGTGRLCAHTPDVLSTVQVPVSWKPEAPKKLKDTLFGDFLLNVCKLSADDVSMLLEFMTYSMTLYNNKKCMLFLVGPSNTGKSVLIKVFEAMIGYYNVSNVALHDLNKKFYPATLRDKLLNSNADNSSVALSGIENIKKITGQDAIMHEEKGKDPFFFFPFAKLVFSFNQLPLQLEEKSDAFYKRLRILSMPNKIELDQEYVDRLLAVDEVSKLATMLLRTYGTQMVKSNKIKNSKHSDFLAQQLRAGSDTIEAFLQEGINRDGLYIEKKVCYNEYVKFCLATERKHCGVQSFYKSMHDKGYTEKRKRVGQKTLTVFEGLEALRK